MENGEHWFLVAFETDVQNVFYTFNSYGIVNTLLAFGYTNLHSESKLVKSNFSNILDRRNAVLELSNLIWGGGRSEKIRVLPKVIDYSGVQQNYGTDECGYHVLRFAIYLFESIIPKHTKSATHNSNWPTVLRSYIQKHFITLLSYESHKFMSKKESDNILFTNDSGVVNFVEQHVELRKFVQSGDLIEVHDEYDLLLKEWMKITTNYKKHYIKFKSNNYFRDLNLIVEYNPLGDFQMVRKRKGIPKLTSKKPYEKRGKNETAIKTTSKQIASTTVDDERAVKTITSLSKMLIQELFPSNLIHRYADPIMNNIQYSGMVEDPNYLDNYMISIPGEEQMILSVREYFKSLKVNLDEKDPYTYCGTSV